MDEDTINLIKNSISNDYCKLICNGAMMKQTQLERDLGLVELMTYCIIYDIEYFIERIYKEKLNRYFFNMQEQMDFIYLYYIESKGKENVNLRNKLINKYKMKRKKVFKEIETMNLINYNRKLIKQNHSKQEDIVIEKYLEVKHRLDIIAMCMKYKILIKYLNLENNKKVDKILNWNLFLVKKINTIEDKFWLI